MSLYSYSPAKIYSIEQILLMDAIQANDNEKIIKLSNLMLQGALISSSYADAQKLLYNILSRMPNPTLIEDGKLNTKFLLLSLVNIEILFNVGDYANCIEVGEDILKVLTPDSIESIKPKNFSIDLFIEHLLETFRLIAFAKLIANDNDIETFFDRVCNAIGEELPEKKAIITLKKYIAGSDYIPSQVEDESPVSKIIYLILQELSILKDDYKNFAQNIYQAKLLSSDLHQTQLEYICDLLIAYAYAKKGIYKKANIIFNDILEKSENSSLFNVIQITRYLMAKIKWLKDEKDDVLIIINEALSDIRNHKNEAVVLYALLEKLYIDTQKESISQEELQIEHEKLIGLSPNGELERIVKSSSFNKEETKDFSDEDSTKTEVHS